MAAHLVSKMHIMQTSRSDFCANSNVSRRVYGIDLLLCICSTCHDLMISLQHAPIQRIKFAFLDIFQRIHSDTPKSIVSHLFIIISRIHTWCILCTYISFTVTIYLLEIITFMQYIQDFNVFIIVAFLLVILHWLLL